MNYDELIEHETLITVISNVAEWVEKNEAALKEEGESEFAGYLTLEAKRLLTAIERIDI